MALINVNLLIRETRKMRGLTQEQLAEGICSRETIVKLENGKQKPNWYIIKEVLMRLGLDPELYNTGVVSQGEARLIEQLGECFSLMNNMKFDEVKVLIDKIEAEIESQADSVWRSELGHGLLLRIKAQFYSFTASSDIPFTYLNVSLAIECALECLKTMRPNFELSNVPDYYLAVNEYRLLLVLAKSYVESGDFDTGIQLYYMLKANMEKKYSYAMGVAHVNHTVNTQYRSMLYFMQIALFRSKRYVEAIQLAEEGISIAIAARDFSDYANYCGILGNCYHKLGQTEKMYEFYKRYYLIIYLFDGHASFNFDFAMNRFEEEHGERLDLTVPW